MALNNVPTLVKTPKHGLAQIANADGTTAKTVVTAGAEGSKVVALYASSTDTSNRDVMVAIVRSGTIYPLAIIQVPLNAGNANNVPTVDLLNSTNFPEGLFAVDGDGQKYLFLQNGDTLTVAAPVAVTATKTISAHADYADF